MLCAAYVYTLFRLFPPVFPPVLLLVSPIGLMEVYTFIPDEVYTFPMAMGMANYLMRQQLAVALARL